MGDGDCLCNAVVQRGKEIVAIVAFCVFMALLYLLFIAIGIVWSLADCTVRKLEKGGDENSDAATTIEFGKLQKINPDIVAWIRIDGLGIDYPVVQGKDNGHYLHYTFRGEANVSGSIFLDYWNKADFSDSKIILYGHNMKNGSMFGSLKKYQDESVFRKNQIISIYLPGNREWKFKVQECRNVKVNDSCYELEDDRAGQVEFEDKELLLSTCSSFADQRLVVFGKLQR